MDEKKIIPNKAFDIEYRTQWRDEVDFLASRGIYYTIRKKEGEFQIPVYKYTKTVDLFIALADFYLQRKRNFRSEATYKPGMKRAEKPEETKVEETNAEEKPEEKVAEENDDTI